MTKNPFVLTFGLKPDNYISRLSQSQEIIHSFEDQTNNVCLITGVRGTGKTVMLSHISEYFSNKDDWMVVELISEADMLDQLASIIYDSSLLHKIIDGKTFSVSFKGISFSVKGEKPVTNVLSFLDMLFSRLNRKNKKVLICVDEAVNNIYMKPFTQAIQLLLRKKYQIYLLMTGLYQNIFELQNNKSLTFLYRAPKVFLEPLSISAIAASYRDIFGIQQEKAIDLAKMTKGYAYAYQVLGHLLWEKGDANIDENLLRDLDQYLQEYVYEKIWSELSGKDKKILCVFNEEKMSVETILRELEISKNEFSVYRERLIKRGILFSPEYGVLSIRLPRFLQYLELKKDLI